MSSDGSGNITPTGGELAINGGPPAPVKPGLRLRDALRERGVMLPSVCGGRGLCGMCKVKVLSGASSFTEEEEKKLSEEERGQGIRLACQVPVEGLLSVELPEELLAALVVESKVVAVVPLNYDTVRVTLAPSVNNFKFTAGQFIQLEIPPLGERTETIWRAYSLASPPSRSEALDIIVRRVPLGMCTTYIHENLKVGDSVRFSGPHGNFRLRNTPARALMLAGGSGIAPILSMVADAADRNLEKPITVVFAGVRLRDIYELDRLRDLGRGLKDFQFVPALSNPADEDHWEGERGLINEVALRLFPDMTGMEAYLCGSPGMIDACVKCLLNAGMSEKNIFFDKFA